MLSLEETIDRLANGMLNTVVSSGFVPPFVGQVDEADEIWGDVYKPMTAASTEEFMAVARSRCENLVREGATVVVVGIYVTLFHTGDPEANRKFGLGGPGDGSFYRNQEASFSITGKAPHPGIAVMAANRQDASAKLFVPRKKGAPKVKLDGLPNERLEEAIKRLFTGLPWPMIH